RRRTEVFVRTRHVAAAGHRDEWTKKVTSEAVPLACDPSAIAPEKRERWTSVVKHLYRLVEEVKELPQGYAFRLPTTEAVLMLAAEEINFERLCCSFLSFELEVEPNHGSTWLRMIGGNAAKEFLRLGFESGDLLRDEVARAAGLRPAGGATLES